jgi:hypothetical protein
MSEKPRWLPKPGPWPLVCSAATIKDSKNGNEMVEVHFEAHSGHAKSKYPFARAWLLREGKAMDYGIRKAEVILDRTLDTDSYLALTEMDFIGANVWAWIKVEEYAPRKQRAEIDGEQGTDGFVKWGVWPLDPVDVFDPGDPKVRDVFYADDGFENIPFGHEGDDYPFGHGEHGEYPS